MILGNDLERRYQMLEKYMKGNRELMHVEKKRKEVTLVSILLGGSRKIGSCQIDINKGLEQTEEVG